VGAWSLETALSRLSRCALGSAVALECRIGFSGFSPVPIVFSLSVLATCIAGRVVNPSRLLGTGYGCGQLRLFSVFMVYCISSSKICGKSLAVLEKKRIKE
jgi:hypothetical protein